MSFILDALRKSETERQRQSAPGLVDAGYRPPARRRGPWLPVLVVVLAANLAVMGYLWLRPDAAPAAGATSDLAPPPAGGSVAATPGASTPVDSDYEASADLPAVDPEPAVAPEPAASPPQPAGLDTAVGPDAAAPVGAASHILTSALPTAEQAMANGAIPAQALHLDIHVYSTTPAERFVFINMRKYGEGALLPEGSKIEEITRDGVVLSQAGQRFVLSRD